MQGVTPLAREELEEFEPFFKLVEGAMGFVPNSLFTMGRRPELLRAFAGLSGTVLAGGDLEPELKQLIAFTTSNAAGCRYCQAHTAHSAHRAGASTEKIDAAFEFETSDLFSDRERAVLRLARDAGLVPNAVNEDHFAELRKHFDDAGIVEIVSVVSLFGWLNRWNDTLATELETSPLRFGQERLGPRGWQVDKHG